LHKLTNQAIDDSTSQRLNYITISIKEEYCIF